MGTELFGLNGDLGCELPAPALSGRGLYKSYGFVAALSGVDVTANFGEVTCILGENGAGKSSLIKILSGCLLPDAGELFVRGRKVNFQSPRDAFHEGIGTVYQDLGLVPLLDAARNFFLGQELTKGVWPLRRLDLKAMWQIAEVELESLGITIRNRRQPVGTLSGGQRQILALARALHLGAQVLILDEPTAALGVGETERVLAAVRAVARSGRAVIMVTHNVFHALDVGDSFVGIRLGRPVGVKSRGCGRDELLAMMGG